MSACARNVILLVVQEISSQVFECAGGGNADCRVDKSVFVDYGSLAQGPLVGVRRNYKDCPFVSRCLAQLVRAALPQIHFHCIAFQCCPPHRDFNNSPGYPNGLVACSDFSGGQLWIQTPEGHNPQGAASSRGVNHSVQPTFCFDPSQLHATQPWHGVRLVIGSFSHQAL